MSGGRAHVTDISNASRTLLFNIHSGDWDDELLRLFDIPRACLPRVLPCSFSPQDEPLTANLDGVAVPITGIAGDQQAALFGQACVTPGMAKNTYGTGCFLLMNTGTTAMQSQQHLLATVAWRLGPGAVQYALEGSVFVGGAAVQWLRDGLGVIPNSEAVEALASSVPDAGGVYFVPAFTGLGAPYWDPQARGALSQCCIAPPGRSIGGSAYLRELDAAPCGAGRGTSCMRVLRSGAGAASEPAPGPNSECASIAA